MDKEQWKVVERYAYLENVSTDIYALVNLTVKLVETLQFYANPDNYEDSDDPEYLYIECGPPTIVELDNGQRARDILKERL